jgi:molecular chaperone HtpG
MPLLSPAPNDVFRTKVMQALQAKATPDDGIAEKAHQLIATATPLLDLIVAGPFKEFTLHNRDHPKKLLHIFESLVPDRTIERLSALECYVSVCAAYLHDLGMVLTSTERERIISSEAFQDTVREWPEFAEALQRSRAKLEYAEEAERPSIEAIIFQLQEAALSRYLRPLHATRTRYSELVTLIKRNAGRSDLFAIAGVSFESALIEICESHNLDVGVLAEVRGTYDERFPRRMPAGGQVLNTQFCAALLRVCDIVDFDRERTPRILFESLAIASRDIPGADVTLREWQKHMAVTSLEIDDEELIITADCHHPVIERAVRDFCQLIERELRETNAVMQRNTAEVCEHYVVTLPITVRAKLRSIGYVFKDMTLRLNEPAIMSLLMGERLYSHPGAAVREMLQNAIDACHMRGMFEVEEHYTPAIQLSHTTDAEGREWMIVEDNGIGMDEYVLNEFFLQAGTSYYRSAEFQRLRALYQEKAFTPISRFGIGVLAVFMIGDALEVETRNPHSRRRDFMGRVLRIERLGGLAFVRETGEERIGTAIRVRLKRSFSKAGASLAPNRRRAGPGARRRRCRSREAAQPDCGPGPLFPGVRRCCVSETEGRSWVHRGGSTRCLESMRLSDAWRCSVRCRQRTSPPAKRSFGEARVQRCAATRGSVGVSRS